MQLLMRRPEIDGFISVAPPANAYDFTFLAPCPSSGLIVHGTNDEAVPEPSVAKLAHKLSSQRNIKVEYELIQGANHTFNTRLDQLTQLLDRYLDRLPMPQPMEVATAIAG
jgi:alpha/beta superfamily hydrolase